MTRHQTSARSEITDTPAGRLVRALGDSTLMATMYAPDIVWTLPSSLQGVTHRIEGAQAVEAFNRYIDTRYDVESIRVEVLQQFGTEKESVARYNFTACALPSGEPYVNEYIIFVRSRDRLIKQVDERMDTIGLARLRGWQI